MKFVYYVIKYAFYGKAKTLLRAVSLIEFIDSAMVKSKQALSVVVDEIDGVIEARGKKSGVRLFATGFGLLPSDVQRVADLVQKIADAQLELLAISRSNSDVWKAFIRADDDVSDGFITILKSYGAGDVDAEIYAEAKKKFIENIIDGQE